MLSYYIMNHEDNNTTKTNIDIGEGDYGENKLINLNATDLCKIYIKNIKNLISIDKEMINNIRNMSNKDKMDIIIEFNDVVESLKLFIGKRVF